MPVSKQILQVRSTLRIQHKSLMEREIKYLNANHMVINIVFPCLAIHSFFIRVKLQLVATLQSKRRGNLHSKQHLKD